MNRCRSCGKWEPYLTAFPNRIFAESEEKKAGGLCCSDKLVEDHSGLHEKDMLVYPFTEGGHFWTGPDFGCVHWEPKLSENPPKLSENSG